MLYLEVASIFFCNAFIEAPKSLASFNAFPSMIEPSATSLKPVRRRHVLYHAFYEYISAAFLLASLALLSLPFSWPS